MKRFFETETELVWICGKCEAPTLGGKWVCQGCGTGAGGVSEGDAFRAPSGCLVITDERKHEPEVEVLKVRGVLA